MSGMNELVVAVAGSGKTTYLVREALKVREENVLIVTYTESNEAEIRQKMLDENGFIPANITIGTWFTFLINHGVRPFQGAIFSFDVKGMLLVSSQSGVKYKTKAGMPVCWSEEEAFEKHYFDSRRRIYSDKLSKLAIRCNSASNGKVFDRIARIYQNIFVDEVQDLAGYDLDFIIGLFESSARVRVVGDPRQVTYLTHHERKYGKYRDGGIVDFIKNEVPKRLIVSIDQGSLTVSHRNSQEICDLSSKLYSSLPKSVACACEACRTRKSTWSGVFIVHPRLYAQYLLQCAPMQLRDNVLTKGTSKDYPVMNFGASKGLGFDHVAIHPTKGMVDWLSNVSEPLKSITRAKLYVALTRARFSVAIVADWTGKAVPAGFSLYE